MGTQGFRIIESGMSLVNGYLSQPPLTDHDLWALPAGTHLSAHIHFAKTEPLTKKVATAERLKRPLSLLHGRTAELTKVRTVIQPPLHGGATGAMNYEVILEGTPYTPRAVTRSPESYTGGRKKRHAWFSTFFKMNVSDRILRSFPR